MLASCVKFRLAPGEAKNRAPKEKAPARTGAKQKDQETIMTAQPKIPDPVEADRRYYREVAVLLTCLGVIAVATVVLAWVG
jgi:hypothetical protein